MRLSAAKKLIFRFIDRLNGEEYSSPQLVEKVIFNWKIVQIQSRLKGNPRRGFPLKNSPPDCFFTLSCVF